MFSTQKHLCGRPISLKNQVCCVYGINRWAGTSQIKLEARDDWLANLMRWSDYVKLWKHALRPPCGSKDSNSEVCSCYITVGVYIKNFIFSVYFLVFILTSFFVVFVPVSHFSFVRFCIYFFTFHCLLHFFLFYSFPSSLIAVFHVLKSSSVFPLFFSVLILRLSLFLPSFRSLEMPFSISCMSTVFTGTRPEPWGRNDNEDMFSYVGLKHPRGWSRKGPNGVVSFSCAW